LTWIKAGAAPAGNSPCSHKEAQMPLETTLAIIAAIAAFGGYALLLGWGVWYTR
jgi:hypothetical protein